MRDPRDDLDELRADAPRGLFLSQRGGWFHDGQRVGHVRLEALLHGSIARDDDGALIVTTGRDRMPFVAEDAPFIVRTLEFVDGDVVLVLSDDSREALSTSPCIDDSGRMRVPVKHARYWALFSKTASQLLERVIDDDGCVRTARGPIAIAPAATTSWAASPR